MHKEMFARLGLSEHEAKIYQALLWLGTSSATKIAQETDIDRATTYRFLFSLIEKGFASYVIRNNVKYYSPANPRKIADDIRILQKDYESFLPQLESLLHLQNEETKVELYKGKEGLKTIMKDILREKKQYTYIGEVEKFFTELSGYGEQWLREVGRSRIKGRLICREDSSFRVAKTESYRLISKKFISKISTWTYGTKTALFIWSDPLFAVLIDNADVTQSNRNLFDFLWDRSKTPSKKHLEKSKLRK